MRQSGRPHCVGLANKRKLGEIEKRELSAMSGGPSMLLSRLYLWALLASR
jgi:hypothetical protein